MADKERDVWQTPRNTGLGMLADALATGKRGLNYIDLIKLLSPPVPAYANQGNIQYDQPRDAKLGLGDILLGNAPEEIDRWSYGDSPFYEQHYGFNPTLRPDRRANILDTALLPVGEAVGAAKLMGRGATKAAEKAGITSLLKDSAPAVEATDEGRRAVLKGLAAVPAAAAAAHIAPKLLEKTAVKDAEKAGAKTAAKAVAHATPREFFDTMRDAHEKAWDNTAYYIEQSHFNPYHDSERAYERYSDDFIRNHGEDLYKTRLDQKTREIEAFPDDRDIFQMADLEDKLAKLRKDPKYAPYKDYMYPYGHHDLGADLITPEHPIHEKIKHKAHGGSIENTTHDRKMI